MERLTERMTDGTADCNCSACPHYKACGDEYYCDDDSECTEKIIDRLCELEDKLESGLLIELPCVREVSFEGGNSTFFEFVRLGKHGTAIETTLYCDKFDAEARLKKLRGE